jgi:hypothetical protein
METSATFVVGGTSGTNHVSLVLAYFDLLFVLAQVHSCSMSSSTEVCGKLNEGSMSKKVVHLWIGSHQNKSKPWSGSLPPPRQSPL